MLDFRDISVHYGVQDVLSNVTFRVNKLERIGVTGPNGSGKSTLFKIILGELSPDHGELVIEEKPRIGSTRQNPQPASPDETLLEYAVRGVAGFRELEAELHSLEARLETAAGEEEKKRILSRLGEVESQFDHLGRYDLETRVKVSLGGLGFEPEQFSQPFAALSGGWRMRAELSRVLASKPDLLLLDEPSNYLDLPAVDWLQRFLKLYDGTLMLISHDRYLLRTLTNRIVEVDCGTATRYEGGLDWYLQERETRFRHLLAAKENQDRRREQLQRFVDRFRAQATKAAQAQSRQKLIDKIDEERIVLPKRATNSGRIRLPEPPPCGVEAVRFENVSFSYDGSRDVLHDISFSVARGSKIAIIGYNGLGKTTIMRLAAGTRKPTAGRVVPGHNTVPGYLSQEFAETIPGDLSVYRNAKNAKPDIQEKILRNQLGAFGFSEEDIEKPAGVLSGGEKIRLAFLRIFLAAPNFLLLDEPTTHLDLDGRALLQDALKKYTGTVLLVSHDIEFVRAVADGIIEITHQGVRSFPGGYDYYKEKTGGAPAAQPAAAPDRPESASVQHVSQKDIRRARAAERAKYAPRMKELKKAVETAEKKIDELQTSLDEASAELFNPSPSTDFAELNRKVRTLQFEIDRYTQDWEKAAEELEKLQSAQNG